MIIRRELLAAACLTLSGCVMPGDSPNYAATPPAAAPVNDATRSRTPYPTQETRPPPSNVPASGPALSRETVASIFKDMLGREPSRVELRELQALSENWSEAQLRADLSESREYRELTPERAIRRAYRDLLNREPDAEGLRHYRRMMIDRGWTAGQVREEIEKGDEYRTRRYDIVIERAYQDLLERAPDPAGLEHYRQFLKRGGSEHDMRAKLRDSLEYRVILPDKKTTKAYRDILKREPDQSGLESYRRKIVDEGWSERDVRNALLRSEEYRNMRK